MGIWIVNEWIAMSAVAGGLYLVFRGLGKWPLKHAAPSWHYGICLIVSSFFLVPYHRLVSVSGLKGFMHRAGVGETAGVSMVKEIQIGVARTAERLLPAGGWQPGVQRPFVHLWQDILPWLLMAGTVVFIGLILVQYGKLHVHIARTCRPADSPQLLGMLETCKRELGIRRSIDLYISPHLTSPFLMGWVKPRIVLPDLPFSAEDCRYVLLHELTHYKRRDPWVKLLMLLINAIHWFNPLAYAARRDIDRFCEFACDARVVKAMDVRERRKYCAFMLRFLWLVADRKAGMYSAFGGRKNDLERRVDLILKMEGTGKNKGVHAVAAGTALAMVLLGVSAACASVPARDQHPKWLPGAARIGLEEVVAVTSESVPVLRNRAFISRLGKDDVISLLDHPGDRRFLLAAPPNGLQTSDPAVSVANVAPAAQVTDKEPLTIGSLSPGRAYTFGSPSIGKGSQVTIHAFWSPADSSLEIGLLSHSSNRIYYATLSGGEGSATLQVDSPGEYSFYAGNSSSSTVQFDLSFIIN